MSLYLRLRVLLIVAEKQSIIFKSNLELFGNAKVPPNRPRQQRIITLKALCDHLLEKPTSYLDEMTVFLFDEFDRDVTISTISRTLVSIGQSPNRMSLLLLGTPPPIPTISAY
jgi:hypothetical protein